MSDRINIVAEPRAVVGKKVKQLRQQGWIPAVVYGQGTPVNIKVENAPLRRALRKAGTNDLLDVVLGDTSYTVLAREVQKHVTRGDLIHVDFLEVDLKATIAAEAQLVAVGSSGLAAEGVAVLALRAVEIECLPEALVDQLEVDLSLIDSVDGVLHVSDLVPPKGVTINTDPETVVARFERFREEVVETEEEEYEALADSVEVIRKAREDEFED